MPRCVNPLRTSSTSPRGRGMSVANHAASPLPAQPGCPRSPLYRYVWGRFPRHQKSAAEFAGCCVILHASQDASLVTDFLSPNPGRHVFAQFLLLPQSCGSVCLVSFPPLPVCIAPGSSVLPSVGLSSCCSPAYPALFVR